MPNNIFLHLANTQKHILTHTYTIITHYTIRHKQYTLLNLNKYQLNREAKPKQLKSKCNANKIDIDFHVKINKQIIFLTKEMLYNEYILQQINKIQCLIGSMAVPQ